MKFFGFLGKSLFFIFAGIGLVFSGVFVSMQFGWMNVRGTIAERNASFFKNTARVAESMNDNATQAVTLCRIHALANYAPETAKKIQTTYETTNNTALVAQMFSFAQLRFLNTTLNADMRRCDLVTVPDMTPVAQTAYGWADSAEWEVLKSAFIRDQDTIRKAATDAGISPRLLLGGIIGEQLRFFTSSRESFKSYFEPLKILASLSKFSYGIGGLKPETVARVDDNLHNPNSVFYLGPNMENVVTYPDGSDHAVMQFNRITDTHDTYYSYLYVGLFMRQIIEQWRKSGYDIATRPDVLATLYNLGFNRSIPKSDPTAGGAIITVNGNQYSFGELGQQFYYSGELVQEFPY